MRTNKVVFLQILRFQTLSLMKKPATQQSMRTVRKCFSTLKSKNKTSPGFNAQFFNRNPYTFQFCNEMETDEKRRHEQHLLDLPFCQLPTEQNRDRRHRTAATKQW